ncbi:MAG: MarR family transcriptional regulator [Mailhella sp.]|nr:MarR family transcriptional regulator [Mailhella sp.]
MVEDSYILICAYRIVRDLNRSTARICAANGLTFPQFQVLEALLHKGGMTVGKIREAVLSSNGTIPVVIGNLQKMGLVQREKDLVDRRKSIVTLTEQGKEVIERICPENDAMIAEKFGVWTIDDKRELIRLFKAYRRESIKT